jgi:Ca-activated chloride channel family protein
MDVRARFEHELLAVETERRVHCMLELTAPPAPAGRTRPPLHLALVLDRSGSMAGPKLDVVRECAAFLVRRLAPTDELALVTYDGEIDLVAPLAPVDQASLLPRIQAIGSGGQTNLSGGWLKGVEELRRASGDGPRKVLLLTDGLANVGVTEPAALVTMAKTTVEGVNVGTTTIGFGADFSEDLLTAMADAGRGNAHFAETPDAAPGIFAQEFEDLVSLVAQNVSVEMRPSDDVELVGFLNAFPAVPVQGGLQLQLGDAYAEESRRVVFEFHIPSLASLGMKSVGEVVLRYTSIGEQIAQHEVAMPLVVNLVSADEAAAAGADAEVTEEVIVLKSTRAQQEAREHADRGEFDAARKLLAEAADELRTIAPSSAKADELLEQAERLEFHSASMSTASYDAISRKRMRFEERTRYENRKRKPPMGDGT